MTQEPATGSGEISPQMRESMRIVAREEIQKQLAELNNAQKQAERAAHNEEYVENKLRRAFGNVPYVRSIAYTRECDEWTLVVTHDSQDKADAHSDLIDKLCDVTMNDPLMPVFEPWILHVSETGNGVPAGEKSILAR